MNACIRVSGLAPYRVSSAIYMSWCVVMTGLYSEKA